MEIIDSFLEYLDCTGMQIAYTDTGITYLRSIWDLAVFRQFIFVFDKTDIGNGERWSKRGLEKDLPVDFLRGRNRSWSQAPAWPSQSMCLYLIQSPKNCFRLNSGLWMGACTACRQNVTVYTVETSMK